MRLFPRSIRWRLQLWYGLILFLVLAGFGITADRLERGRQLRRIDQELQGRISVLATAFRPPPREPGGPSGLGLGPGPGPGPGSGMGPGWRRPGAPRGPDGEQLSGPERRGGERERWPGPEVGHRPAMLRRELRLAPEDAGLFDRDEVNPFYYVIWSWDGRLHTRSASAPVPMPAPARSGPGTFPSVRTREDLREAYVFAGPGDCILVGRSVASDWADMDRRTAWLLVTGLGVMVLGLAGGWWLATRAIRPVEIIGATAERISGGDLSQRIDLAETESELGHLAGVLNSTFARLEASFSHQARFTSDAAHELRTPVTVLLTQTQTALARDRSTGEYRETLEACQRAAQRMRRLIESLLALARLEGGREPMARRRLDLATIARESAELVRPLADARGITIEVDLPALSCDGDPDGLMQVLTNLLTNGIQYNRDGGRVRLHGRQSDGQVEVSVTDTGPGIAEEDRPHVFDRFYRSDKSRTGGSNAGLGLAISKAITDRHGGTLVCESTPGEGATFTLRVPGASGGPPAS